MSAFVVQREHIDVLVRAAVDSIRLSEIDGKKFQWWKAPGGDDGMSFDGWRYLDVADLYERDEDWMTPTQVGQMLVDENVASVRYRYPVDPSDPSSYELPGADTHIEPYSYVAPAFVATPGEVFATIDCYSYQSCEHPDWYPSEANSFCRFLRAEWCKLVPGYDETPHEWDANNILVREKLVVRLVREVESASQPR